jgi:CHAT domain-containing protein/tetratricopeptide (TPR) repeat protein
MWFNLVTRYWQKGRKRHEFFSKLVFLTACAGLVRAQAPLEAGKPVQRQLNGGESHEYRFRLEAGQFARIWVEQESIQASVTILWGEKKVFEAGDASIGSRETAEIIADGSGEHRVVVAGTDPTAPAGTYSITLHDVETATDRHRELLAGTQLYAQALSYWHKGSREWVLKAAEAFEGALVHWRVADERLDEVYTLASLAHAYADIGDREKALRCATEALAVARAASLKSAEAGALSSLGFVYNSFGDRKEAMKLFDESLPLMRAAQDRVGEGTLRNNIGIAHTRTGELAKALEDFQSALEIFTQIHDRGRVATMLCNIGLVYGDLAEYRKAIDYYQRALTIQQELKNRTTEAITHNNIGTAYSSIGEYQKGLDSFRRALELHRALGLEWDSAINLHNIAWIHANLGDRERARTLYQEALESLRKVKDQLGTANTLNNLAEIYADSDDYKKALELHTEALISRRATKDREGEAISLTNIGKAYAKLGQQNRARENFESALAILRTGVSPRRLANTLLHSGSLYHQQCDDEHALYDLDESLAIAREIEDRRAEADALTELARVESDRGNTMQAHERAHQALETFESVRLSVASPSLRLRFFSIARDLQEMDIALLMSLNLPEKAFLESERSKARSLLELLPESGTEIRRGVDAELIKREYELNQLISAKAERQTRLLNKSQGAEAVAASRELNALTVELEDVQSMIRHTSPSYAELTKPAPLSLREIQEQVLDPDTVLLEFSLGSRRSFLWAVAKSSADAFELPPRPMIEMAVRRVRESLTARNQIVANETVEARSARVAQADAAYQAAASKLSAMLFGPVAKAIFNKRLLIVVEGDLQYVPFASLPDANRVPMIVNHEIITAPSASVVAVIRQESANRKSAEKLLAVLADPVFTTDDPRFARSALRNDASEFVRLRFSRAEADAITKLAPAVATLKAVDFDASRETALHADLGQYRIIHFATHSVLNNDQPELSGIMLSRVDRAGRPRDGLLRLYDIYNLRLKSDLVVLSACRTALGGEVKGEGLIGLTRGFLYAGAPRVVATLWEVEDRTTAEIMKHFYTAILSRGEKPAQALRSAQIALWKTRGWENPYYWAAFTLQGDWR